MKLARDLFPFPNFCWVSRWIFKCFWIEHVDFFFSRYGISFSWPTGISIHRQRAAVHPSSRQCMLERLHPHLRLAISRIFIEFFDLYAMFLGFAMFLFCFGLFDVFVASQASPGCQGNLPALVGYLLSSFIYVRTFLFDYAFFTGRTPIQGMKRKHREAAKTKYVLRMTDTTNKLPGTLTTQYHTINHLMTKRLATTPV